MSNNSFEVTFVYGEDGRLSDWIYIMPDTNSQDYLKQLLAIVRNQQEPLKSEVHFVPVTKEVYDGPRLDAAMDEHPMWATPEKEFEYKLAAFLDVNMTPQRIEILRREAERGVFGPRWEGQAPVIPVK